MPRDGLLEVLTAWSGAGSVLAVDDLIEALAAIDSESPDVLADRRWAARDIRARASRVALGRCLPLVAELPSDVRDWIEAVPATSVTQQRVGPRLSRPVDWAATTVRNRGWPPRGVGAVYVGRPRRREPDTLLVGALRWTAAELAVVRREAGTVAEGVERGARGELEAVDRAASSLPGLIAEPRDDELDAVERAGWPWHSLAPLARELQRLRRDVYAFAFEVVLPEETLRWRLFHLAVYGEVLARLRASGVRLRSLGPLTGGSRRPSHAAALPDGRRVELWLEASGCWRRYGGAHVEAFYTRATAAVRGGRRALAPDCLLVVLDPQDTPIRALSLECKYSQDRTYVARTGYLQALAYGTELALSLDCDVSSVVVGPEDVVDGVSTARRPVASPGGHAIDLEIGVSPPAGLGHVVATALR